MNTPKIKYLGARLSKDGLHTTVWAPQAKSVVLQTIESNKQLPLVPSDYGYWEAHSTDIKAGERYKIVLDGKSYPDPASYSQPNGVHEASELVDLDFAWSDEQYVSPSLKDFIIYELHVGTFSHSHDFQGVISKFPYLKKLGVNAIEIMPLGQFPGERNWGYDGVFPFAVQSSYGGPKGFQQLVDAAHQHGIAVIVDVVYNHFGPEGNYAQQFGPYLTDKYGTPWGSAVNFDDAHCNGVRDFVLVNVRMWFEDYHVDALRIDAAHALKDLGSTHILQEIRKETDTWIKQQNKHHYLIIECDLNDRRYLDSTEKHGFGMDAQWVDEFHHALRVAAGEKPQGYYADFHGVKDLAKSFQDAYVYTGQYSKHREKFFGSDSTNLSGKHFVVFSQNHDQTGNRMLGERSSMLFSEDMQRLMALTVMASPFVPMLFMGEEWAASTPFQYFIDHSDEELIDAVRRGRKEEFKSFQSDEEAPDPQAVDTFADCVLKWEEQKEKKHENMLNYYESLIAFRKSNSILRQVDRSALRVEHDEQKKLIILYYSFEEVTMIGVMNFSKHSQNIDLYSEHSWEKIWETCSPTWGGSTLLPDLFTKTLKLPAESGAFYQQLQ